MAKTPCRPIPETTAPEAVKPQMMNSFDILIAVITGFCMVRGLFRGFIKEFFSIIGVFAGFFAATRYYGSIASLISGEIINPAYLPLVAFMVVFTLIYLIISVLGVIIKYLLKITILGWVDRVFGAISGTLKGALIAAVLMLALVAFLPAGSPFLTRSHLAPYLISTTEKMVLVVPKAVRQQFNENLKAVKKGLAANR